MSTISNKKLCLQTILSYVALWLIYFITEVITGRISGMRSIIINLVIPTIFMALSGLLFWFFSTKHPEKFKTKTIILSILILVFIDQFVKLLIRSYSFEGASIEILLNWLFFSPVLNTSGSWAASRYGLTLGFNIFIIINLIGVLFILQVYRFYISRNKAQYFTDISFILIFSGALCSLIDKTFFGGSLDFIGIDSLFVADLKDFYLTLSIGLLLSFFLGEEDSKTTFKDDIKLIKDFIKFNFKGVLK